MMTLPVATIAAPASTTSRWDNYLNPLDVKIVALASTMLTTVKLDKPPKPLPAKVALLGNTTT